MADNSGAGDQDSFKKNNKRIYTSGDVRSSQYNDNNGRPSFSAGGRQAPNMKPRDNASRDFKKTPPLGLKKWQEKKERDARNQYDSRPSSQLSQRSQRSDGRRVLEDDYPDNVYSYRKSEGFPMVSPHAVSNCPRREGTVAFAKANGERTQMTTKSTSLQSRTPLGSIPQPSPIPHNEREQQQIIAQITGFHQREGLPVTPGQFDHVFDAQQHSPAIDQEYAQGQIHEEEAETQQRPVSPEFENFTADDWIAYSRARMQPDNEKSAELNVSAEQDESPIEPAALDTQVPNVADEDNDSVATTKAVLARDVVDDPVTPERAIHRRPEPWRWLTSPIPQLKEKDMPQPLHTLLLVNPAPRVGDMNDENWLRIVGEAPELADLLLHNLSPSSKHRINHKTPPRQIVSPGTSGSGSSRASSVSVIFITSPSQRSPQPQFYTLPGIKRPIAIRRPGSDPEKEDNDHHIVHLKHDGPADYRKTLDTIQEGFQLEDSQPEGTAEVVMDSGERQPLLNQTLRPTHTDKQISKTLDDDQYNQSHDESMEDHGIIESIETDSPDEDYDQGSAQPNVGSGQDTQRPQANSNEIEDESFDQDNESEQAYQDSVPEAVDASKDDFKDEDQDAEDPGKGGSGAKDVDNEHSGPSSRSLPRTSPPSGTPAPPKDDDGVKIYRPSLFDGRFTTPSTYTGPYVKKSLFKNYPPEPTLSKLSEKDSERLPSIKQDDPDSSGELSDDADSKGKGKDNGHAPVKKEWTPPSSSKSKHRTSSRKTTPQSDHSGLRRSTPKSSQNLDDRKTAAPNDDRDPDGDGSDDENGEDDYSNQHDKSFKPEIPLPSRPSHDKHDEAEAEDYDDAAEGNAAEGDAAEGDAAEGDAAEDDPVDDVSSEVDETDDNFEEVPRKKAPRKSPPPPDDGDDSDGSGGGYGPAAPAAATDDGFLSTLRRWENELPGLKKRDWLRKTEDIGLGTGTAVRMAESSLGFSPDDVEIIQLDGLGASRRWPWWLRFLITILFLAVATDFAVLTKNNWPVASITRFKTSLDSVESLESNFEAKIQREQNTGFDPGRGQLCYEFLERQRKDTQTLRANERTILKVVNKVLPYLKTTLGHRNDSRYHIFKSFVRSTSNEDVADLQTRLIDIDLDLAKLDAAILNHIQEYRRSAWHCGDFNDPEVKTQGASRVESIPLSNHTAVPAGIVDNTLEALDFFLFRIWGFESYLYTSISPLASAPPSAQLIKIIDPYATAEPFSEEFTAIERKFRKSQRAHRALRDELRELKTDLKVLVDHWYPESERDDISQVERWFSSVKGKISGIESEGIEGEETWYGRIKGRVDVVTRIVGRRYDAIAPPEAWVDASIKPLGRSYAGIKWFLEKTINRRDWYNAFRDFR